MLDKSKNIGYNKPYLRNINVRWFDFNLDDLLEMPFTQNELERYSIKKNDLVICEGGEPGRCAIWDKDETIMFQKALHRLRMYCGISPYYISFYLLYLASTGQLNNYFTGSGIKHLTGESLANIEIPLPPLNEQNHIVKELDNWIGYANDVDSNKGLLLKNLDAAKSKILELAMRGKLVPQDPADEPAADMLRRINPKARIITDNPHYPKWLCSYLGDICGFERGITFPSDTKRFDKIPGYIACLRTANVHDEVDLSSLWYISEEYLKGNDAKKLKAGDILMSTANSKELVGRSVIIRNLSEPATFGGFVTVLRTQILLPEFFKLFLKYKTLKGDFSKIATQTTNIANLNTKILSTVITPIPPRVEQSRIIQRVNQLFSILEEIEASLQSTL